MLRSNFIGLVELICSLWLGGVKVLRPKSKEKRARDIKRKEKEVLDRRR
jgi:hypothetical protein